MRRPVALLVLVSAVLSGSVFAARQGLQAINPMTADPSAVSEGRNLYNTMCQSCHGAAGQGTDRGPAFASGAFAHGSTDADLFRSIRSGIPGTQMAGFPGLSDADTWRLVTYLKSLQPGAAATPSDTAPAAGDAPAGETLFFGPAQCADCHEVNGRGGIVGPDLSGAARFAPATLRQKLLEPDTPITAASGGRGRSGSAPATVVVKTADGRSISGVRKNEDTFSLQMIDTAGGLHLFDKGRSHRLPSRTVRCIRVTTRLASRLRTSRILSRTSPRFEGATRRKPRQHRSFPAASPTSVCSTRNLNRTTG